MKNQNEDKKLEKKQQKAARNKAEKETGKPSVKERIHSKNFKHGTLSTLFSIGFIVVIVLVNVIFSVLTDRFPSMDIDLTKNSVNTLSDDAIKVVDAVDNKTVINILASETDANVGEYTQVVSLAKKMAETLGVELEIVKSDWDSLVPAVQSGTVDCVIAGQSMTADRMAEVDMAGPYYYATIVCVTTKDSKYADATSIADLAGGTCTAQSGTIWYESCLPQIENANLLAPAETAPAMIMQLQTGTVDFICTDMPTAMGAVAKDDNLVILNFSGTDGDFQFATEEERAENVNIGISVQKGNTALKDAINTVLSAMTEDDFNALMDQAIAIQPEV